MIWKREQNKNHLKQNAFPHPWQEGFKEGNQQEGVKAQNHLRWVQA